MWILMYESVEFANEQVGKGCLAQEGGCEVTPDHKLQKGRLHEIEHAYREALEARTSEP